MMQNDRSSRAVWLPIAAGLGWLWSGADHGLLPFIFALVPGTLSVSAGVSLLRFSGDSRGRELACLGGGAGILFAVPGLLVFGPGLGLLLFGLSAWSYLDAASRSARELPTMEGLPAPDSDLKLSAKLGIDEALLGGMGLVIPMPRTGEIVRIAHEVAEAKELFESQGWFEKPEDYHRRPLSLDAPRIERASTLTRRGSLAYEHLSFDSEYEPLMEEPGRDRWLSYTPNRMAHAWVLRHSDEPRPWLMCLHGYQMGAPWLDFGLFDPHYLHDTKGFNLILPTLPLHGRRKIGRLSGDGFLAGDVLDTIHAESQAMWDLRRLISWVETQGAESIGAYGVSLGGCGVSLLAGLAPGLSGVIAGVPLTDFGRIFWAHGPPQLIRDYLEIGIDLEELRSIFRVISPLSLDPQLPRERRSIFAGLGDRLVPIDQVADLWRHWEEPEATWYQGSHISFMGEPDVRRLIDSSLEGMKV